MGKAGWVLTLALVLSVVFVAGSTAYAAEEKKDEGTAAPAPAVPKTKAEILKERLEAMQKALEACSTKNQNDMPADTKELIEFLPNKEKDLINPETEKPIVMNPTLAGQTPRQIEKPEEFITFWADQPTAGTGRAVITASGVVKYLDEKAFKKAQDNSKLEKLAKADRRDYFMDRRQSRRER